MTEAGALRLSVYVAEEDRVRRHLIDGLSSLELGIWANVELTTDPDLAR